MIDYLNPTSSSYPKRSTYYPTMLDNLKNSLSLESKHTLALVHSPGARERLRRFFISHLFHYLIISIVFLDLILLLISLVLVIYNTEATINASTVLFMISWIFPAIFIVEFGLKIWVAGGWTDYFSTRLHIWDAVLVVLSVVSDVVLYLFLMDHVAATSTNIVFFRLWKIVRLFHAFAHINELMSETSQKELLLRLDQLEDEVVFLRQENHRLRVELTTVPTSIVLG